MTFYLIKDRFCTDFKDVSRHKRHGKDRRGSLQTTIEKYNQNYTVFNDVNNFI